MCKLSLFQRSNILSVFAGVLLFAVVSGCVGHDSSGNGGISPSYNDTAITIDNAGVIPVFGNSPTSTVVYVHNNSGASINGISYSVAAQNNAALTQSKSKFLNSLSTNTSLLNSGNINQCSVIAAGQSCPLSITTPVLSGATTQGSLEVKASYTQNNKVINFTQLISYAQVQNNLQSSGAKFQTGVSISGNGNSVGYGTIYLYGSGQNQIYDVSSIIIDKSAIKIVNGNISGQQIQSNFVQAVEISSPISDSSVSATITVNSSVSASVAALGTHSNKSLHTSLGSSNSLLAGDQFSNSIDVTVEPANSGAILTAGFVPLINTVNGTSGSLLIHNSGDQTAAVGAVSAGSGISNLSGCSNSSLPANAACTITFNVTESGGSANITVPYTGGSAGSVAANVTWFNGASAALVSMSSSVDPISFPATENGSTTITVTNIGGYVLTNVNIPAPVVIGGGATATLGTNICSGIQLLPVGGSCEYVVNVADSQTDLGQQINAGFSASYTGVDGTKEYSRILPINYNSTSNGAVISITPSTPDVAIIGNGIDSTTQVLTLSNSGNLPATITSSVLSDNPSFLVESSTTCGASLASGESCVYNLKLGPTLSPVESSGVSRYTINYTANGQAPSGSVTSQVNWSLQGYEQSISLTAFAAVGESSGNGLSGTPFVFSGSSSSSKYINLTYKNTGTDPTMITAIQESNPTYTWVVANGGDGCSNVPLQPNEECHMSYINVLYLNAASLGVIGATYTENFTVPALTYHDISIPSLQSNSQPNVPGGGVIIYAQSNQATLANTLTVYGAGTAAESVVVTNLLANADGYNDVFVISTMEDYLVPVSSDPYSPTCASDSSDGALKQSCTLSQNMLLGTGTYLVNQSSLNPNTDLILNAEFSTNSATDHSQVLSLNTTASANLGKGPVYAYAVDTGTVAGGVTQCNVNLTTGMLGNCSLAISGGFSRPRQIAVYNGFVYVGNATGTLMQCAIGANGISSCSDAGSGLSDSSSIAFSNGFAYIGTFNDGVQVIEQCNVASPSGAVSNCTEVKRFSDNATYAGMAVNNGFLYVALLDDGVSQVVNATINPTTGSLSAWVSYAPTDSTSGDPVFNDPSSIAFNNGFVYISNKVSNNVVQCSVNAVNGALSACTTAASGFQDPSGVSIANGFIYVTNTNPNFNFTSVCSISSSNGALSACINSGGTNFNEPWGIMVDYSPT